jgi:uncharacterized membrane protein (UPF0127 family)
MAARPRRFRRLTRTQLRGLEVPVATSFLSRFLGLALLPRELAGPGLLVPRCRSVHTFGMRFRLDLLFLDADEGVLEIRRDVPPARVARCARAAAVLEVPAQEPRGRSIGQSGANPCSP